MSITSVGNVVAVHKLEIGFVDLDIHEDDQLDEAQIRRFGEASRHVARLGSLADIAHEHAAKGAKHARRLQTCGLLSTIPTWH
jgi:hypothetical protein